MAGTQFLRARLDADLQLAIDLLQAGLGLCRGAALGDQLFILRFQLLEMLNRIGLAMASGLELEQVLEELYRQCRQVISVASPRPGAEL